MNKYKGLSILFMILRNYTIAKLLRNVFHTYDDFLCSKYDYFMSRHISGKISYIAHIDFFFCSQKTIATESIAVANFWSTMNVRWNFATFLSLSLSPHKTQFVFTRFQEDKDRISGALYDGIFIVSILSKEFCSCRSSNCFQNL